MIKCPKCGKELEDGTKFCEECGAQVFETIFCPNCGAQTSTEFTFCEKCGAPLSGPAPAAAPSGPVPTAAPAGVGSAAKKPIPKKALMFGGIGIAAVVVIALVVSLISGGGGSGKKFAMYLKDGEIFYTTLSTKDKPLEITERLTRDMDLSEYEQSTMGGSLGMYVAFNEKGTRVFYPDRADDSGEGRPLYYRDIDKTDMEPVKIDSDVISYAINKDGTTVVYQKGETYGGDLYIHDLKDKDKIASDVNNFAVTEDCKKVLYLTDEGDIYLWTAGKDGGESAKVVSEVESIQHISDDLSTIYYTKEESLYKQKTEEGGDKEKIAGDVYRVVNVYDSGEIYYIKQDTESNKLMDYVNDDMASADANMTEPVRPTYPQSPYRWDYETDEEYYAAQDEYNRAYAAYEDALDKYWEDTDAYQAKNSRDRLRENLKNETYDLDKYTLYYYNGTESAEVTDALADAWSISCAADSPAALLSLRSESDVKKVKLSEISSIYDVSNMVREALSDSGSEYLAQAASMTEIEQEEGQYFQISDDGTAIAFLDNVSDDGEGELYKVAVTKDGMGDPELYDEDVSNMTIYFTDKNELVYFKNVKNDNNYYESKGDLYIDKTEVDYDVRVSYLGDLNGTPLYYTDWNAEKGYGTLKMFQKGEKVKVAEDVHSYMVVGEKDLLYISDFSSSHYKGTLNTYNNGKPEKIDDDVSALIPVVDQKVMGGYYYGW